MAFTHAFYAAAGILLAFLTPGTISRFIGRKSGWWGVDGAALIGSVTLIPGFLAFHLAALLLKNGAGAMQIGAFVSTLMTVGGDHAAGGNQVPRQEGGPSAQPDGLHLLVPRRPGDRLGSVMKKKKPLRYLFPLLCALALSALLLADRPHGLKAAQVTLYGAFPVAAVFMRKGVKFTNLLIFLGAWSTTKIPMFQFELSSLGVGFALSRLLVNIPGIIGMAFLLRLTLRDEEVSALYARAAAMEDR